MCSGLPRLYVAVGHLFWSEIAFSLLKLCLIGNPQNGIYLERKWLTELLLASSSPFLSESGSLCLEKKELQLCSDCCP